MKIKKTYNTTRETGRQRYNQRLSQRRQVQVHPKLVIWSSAKTHNPLWVLSSTTDPHQQAGLKAAFSTELTRVTWGDVNSINKACLWYSFQSLKKELAVLIIQLQRNSVLITCKLQSEVVYRYSVSLWCNTGTLADLETAVNTDTPAETEREFLIFPHTPFFHPFNNKKILIIHIHTYQKHVLLLEYKRELQAISSKVRFVIDFLIQKQKNIKPRNTT